MDDNTKTENIRRFWNDQGDKFLDSIEATTPDPLAKELELEALEAVLDRSKRTLEAGCGNGYNLFSLSTHIKEDLVGFDYSNSMIEVANKTLLNKPKLSSRISFYNASILDDISSLGSFPQIFTDRCLINLTSINQQIDALNNLSNMLDFGGNLVLIESTKQGQSALNSLREYAGLPKIPSRWHNLFIDEEEFFRNIPDSLMHVKTENFSSLYFVISRVFNAKLAPQGKEPDYMSEINKLAKSIPTFGANSPLKLFQFKKVK
ncbi:class I SAM-dependent methyltransferase [bacterium]|jgi:SAM-dependent methyltransferase|nr:class I SAM-dependent methyltransferase [bacterium]